MKLWITETEKVKRQAGEDAVIILQLWKQKVRRLRIYRACLCAVLILPVWDFWATVIICGQSYSFCHLHAGGIGGIIGVGYSRKR